jgi:hypothetical protein
MTSSKRAVLGVLAVAPLVYFLIFLLVLFPLFVSEIRADREHGDSAAFQRVITFVVVVHALMMALALGVLVGFGVHLYRLPIDSGRKTIWALALFFGNVFVAPLYYYVYFVRRRRSDARTT